MKVLGQKDIKNGRRKAMTENMMQEILDDWMSWKYDIIEMNNSTWTVRDESKLNMIGVILEEKMKEFKGDK
jgi:hypothetical protein